MSTHGREIDLAPGDHVLIPRRMRHRVERTAPEGGNDLVDCPLWRGVDAYPLHYLGPDKGKPFPASPIDPGSPCENGYIEGFSGKL